MNPENLIGLHLTTYSPQIANRTLFIMISCIVAALLASASAMALPQTQSNDVFTLSKPFNLKLQSLNATYNNVFLDTCHEGPAVSSLCVANEFYHPEPGTAPSPPVQFYFNSTAKNDGRGTLVRHTEPYWPAFHVYISPTENVAHGTFGYDLRDGTQFKFSSDQKLTIEGKSNWYMCYTTVYTRGSPLTTLEWIVGAQAVPDNKTCVKVDVLKASTDK